jgi:hypothetical protein
MTDLAGTTEGWQAEYSFGVLGIIYATIRSAALFQHFTITANGVGG